MEIVSRKAWGARAPRHVDLVPWSQRTGVMIHYSAANVNQTVRAIQDYHMDTRDWADIGYNLLVRASTGTIYMGRGWDVVGAHCAGHNTANVGICVIGPDVDGRQDVSDEARTSVRWLVGEIERRAGRDLALLGHRDRGNTECPGDELFGWIRKGMPGSTPLPPPAPGGGSANWLEVAVRKLDTIKVGSRGPDTKKSQSLLAAAGFPPRNSFTSAHRPDGVAGDGWGDACEAFQRSRGIKADRECGPITWGELLE